MQTSEISCHGSRESLLEATIGECSREAMAVGDETKNYGPVVQRKGNYSYVLYYVLNVSVYIAQLMTV